MDMFSTKTTPLPSTRAVHPTVIQIPALFLVHVNEFEVLTLSDSNLPYVTLGNTVTCSQIPDSDHALHGKISIIAHVGAHK